jgi:Fe-S-cluster containining protein
MEVEEWLERDCRQTLDGRYVLKSREIDDVCIYLDQNKQCTIYTVRPQQCAAFPWWSENLATDRAWREVKETCPGLTADDALIIDGEAIRIHVFADRESTKGFRSWPPWNKKVR